MMWKKIKGFFFIFFCSSLIISLNSKDLDLYISKKKLTKNNIKLLYEYVPWPNDLNIEKNMKQFDFLSSLVMRFVDLVEDIHLHNIVIEIFELEDKKLQHLHEQRAAMIINLINHYVQSMNTNKCLTIRLKVSLHIIPISSSRIIEKKRKETSRQKIKEKGGVFIKAF